MLTAVVICIAWDQVLTFYSVHSKALKLREGDVFKRRLPIELQSMSIQLRLRAGINLSSSATKLHRARSYRKTITFNVPPDKKKHWVTMSGATEKHTHVHTDVQISVSSLINQSVDWNKSISKYFNHHICFLYLSKIKENMILYFNSSFWNERIYCFVWSQTAHWNCLGFKLLVWQKYQQNMKLS